MSTSTKDAKSGGRRSSTRKRDPDVIRLDELETQYDEAASHDAQWAMMYFMEDNTHEIQELLARLATKGIHRTFPGIFVDHNP